MKCITWSYSFVRYMFLSVTRGMLPVHLSRALRVLESTLSAVENVSRVLDSVEMPSLEVLLTVQFAKYLFSYEPSWCPHASKYCCIHTISAIICETVLSHIIDMLDWSMTICLQGHWEWSSWLHSLQLLECLTLIPSIMHNLLNCMEDRKRSVTVLTEILLLKLL